MCSAAFRPVRSECFSGYYNKRTVTGRRLPKLVSQASMRERAQELIKLRHEQYISPSGAASKLKASQMQLAPVRFDLFFEPGHKCAVIIPSTIHSAYTSPSCVENDPPPSFAASKCRSLGSPGSFLTTTNIVDN